MFALPFDRNLNFALTISLLSPLSSILQPASIVKRPFAETVCRWLSSGLESKPRPSPQLLARNNCTRSSCTLFQHVAWALHR